MKKQIDILKLTCMAAAVAMVTVGCASSGQARVDTDDDSMGASANAEVGTANADLDIDVDRSDIHVDRDLQTDLDTRNSDIRVYSERDDADVDVGLIEVNENEAASARATVSALSFVPETRPEWINRFGIDWATRMQTIEVYTFRVPAMDLDMDNDLPRFSANLPVGSAYVEAAGGEGDLRTRRVIQHSPNPSR